jgi:hypothetical protein
MYTKQFFLTLIDNLIAKKMTSLDLELGKENVKTAIDKKDLQNLRDALKERPKHTIKSISLNKNGFSDAGVEVLVSILKENQGIDALYLASNNIHMEGFGALLACKQLKDLSLANNPLGVDKNGTAVKTGWKEIFDGLIQGSLLKLNLSSCTEIKGKINPLVHALTDKLVPLTYLDLGSNELADYADRLFQGEIKVESMNLSNNNIDAATAKSLFSKQLPQHLKDLYICSNPMADGIGALCDRLDAGNLGKNIRTILLDGITGVPQPIAERLIRSINAGKAGQINFGNPTFPKSILLAEYYAAVCDQAFLNTDEIDEKAYTNALDNYKKAIAAKELNQGNEFNYKTFNFKYNRLHSLVDVDISNNLRNADIFLNWQTFKLLHCAIASQQAYNSANYQPKDFGNSGWKLLRTTNTDTVFSSDNDVKLQLQKTGYFATAFINEKTKQIIIAHRGTVIIENATKESVASIMQDLSILTEYPPSCHFLAVQFSEQIQLEHKDYVIAHTGHSLGAVIAEICAYHFSAPAVTFESPGSHLILNRYREMYASQKTLPEVNDWADEKLITIVNHPNFVNTINKHAGKMIRIFSKDYSLADEQNLVTTFLNLIYNNPSVIPQAALALSNGSLPTIVQSAQTLFFLIKTVINMLPMAGTVIDTLKTLAIKLKNIIKEDISHHGLDKMVAYLDAENFLKIGMRREHIHAWPVGLAQYLYVTQYANDYGISLDTLLDQHKKWHRAISFYCDYRDAFSDEEFKRLYEKKSEPPKPNVTPTVAAAPPQPVATPPQITPKEDNTNLYIVSGCLGVNAAFFLSIYMRATPKEGAALCVLFATTSTLLATNKKFRNAAIVAASATAVGAAGVGAGLYSASHLSDNYHLIGTVGLFSFVPGSYAGARLGTNLVNLLNRSNKSAVRK